MADVRPSRSDPQKNKFCFKKEPRRTFVRDYVPAARLFFPFACLFQKIMKMPGLAGQGLKRDRLNYVNQVKENENKSQTASRSGVVLALRWREQTVRSRKRPYHLYSREINGRIGYRPMWIVRASENVQYPLLAYPWSSQRLHTLYTALVYVCILWVCVRTDCCLLGVRQLTPTVLQQSKKKLHRCTRTVVHRCAWSVLSRNNLVSSCTRAVLRAAVLLHEAYVM